MLTVLLLDDLLKSGTNSSYVDVQRLLQPLVDRVTVCELLPQTLQFPICHVVLKLAIYDVLWALITQPFKEVLLLLFGKVLQCALLTILLLIWSGHHMIEPEDVSVRSSRFLLRSSLLPVLLDQILLGFPLSLFKQFLALSLRHDHLDFLVFFLFYLNFFRLHTLILLIILCFALL